ncbi:Subtilisin-like protein [Diaporthe amygdali]|uniref:Subtilisin-like protein n=1 Tax=Phomopsis amygdali TaxID=1214568 RepID=UPI0022FE4077|nr:Subtilisin-like protein [Diaporthe amygdali]KAJ0120502.1 Subtilisin-like protein [Diaporthe amygdali]
MTDATKGPVSITSQTRLCWEAFDIAAIASILDAAHLKSTRERFDKWCRESGSHLGGLQSLDERLRDAPKPKILVIECLEGVLETLTKNAQPTTEASSQDEKSRPMEDIVLERFLSSIVSENPLSHANVMIDVLFRLNVLIRSDLSADRYQRAQITAFPDGDEKLFLNLDEKQLWELFPALTQELMQRLLSASIRRRRILQYTHDCRENLKLDREQLPLAEGKAPQRPVTEAISSPKDVASDSLISPQLSLSNSAWLADMENASETSSISSFSRSLKYRIPSFPEEADDPVRDLRTCIACYLLLPLRNQKQWETHILRDLRPLKDFETHLAEAHPNATKSLPPQTLVRRREISAETEITCAFCSEKIKSRKEIESHIGRHQKQIALMALSSMRVIHLKSQDDESDAESMDVQHHTPDFPHEEQIGQQPDPLSRTNTLDQYESTSPSLTSGSESEASGRAISHSNAAYPSESSTSTKPRTWLSMPNFDYPYDPRDEFCLGQVLKRNNVTHGCLSISDILPIRESLEQISGEGTWQMNSNKGRKASIFTWSLHSLLDAGTASPTSVGFDHGPVAPIVSHHAELINLSLYTHTEHVYNAFQRLLETIEQVKSNHIRCSGKVSKIMDQFGHQLRAEFLIFKNILSEMTDACFEVGEDGWRVVEEATFKRCGSYYGTYVDSLSHMKIELADIFGNLGLRYYEEIPGSHGNDTSDTHWKIHIRELLASTDRWTAFLSALITITGAAGGALQLHISNIKDANERLMAVKREARKEPSQKAFQCLDDLRDDAKTAAEVLGDENGFFCQCNPPHRVFIRLTDCFDLDNSEPPSQPRDRVCNLVVHNPSPLDAASWKWARIDAEVRGRSGNAAPTLPVGSSNHSHAEKTKSALNKQGHESQFTVLLTDIFHKKSTKSKETKGKEGSSSMILSTVPKMGLCAFIHHHRNLEKRSNSQPRISDIVLSRHKSELGLQIQDDETQTARLWANPTSIRSQFKSIDHSGLSTEDKLQLAFSVGLSLFYLHSTPWLQKSWNSDDVYLPKQDNGVTCIEPWLAKRTRTRRSSTDSYATDSHGAAISPIITRFGRFLIELCYGAPWDQIRNVFLPDVEPSLTWEADLSIFLNIFSREEDPRVATADKPCYHEDKWFDEYAQAMAIAATVSPSRPEQPQNRIRIAVLDTGVDVTHDLLKGPWRRGQIIYQDFVKPDAKLPQDEHGHGTHVTSIVLKVAENVDVYVGRISPDGEKFNSSQVEKAIEWAVQEKKAHIISMSFGFPNVDQSLEPIRRAILKAHAQDVLFFAATGNKGKGHPISFPACMDEVISVGSTDGNNQTSDFVPSLGPGKRLCTIGEAINAAWIGKGRRSHGTMVRKAGTSYATPVAAGVAAMVMDFVCSEQHRRTRGGSATERYEYQMLKTKRGMLAVLAHMMERDERDAIERLTPWKLFNKSRAEPLSDEPRCGILDEIIVTLRLVYTGA